jgi:predicted nucleic acid-binding protein
MLKAHYFDASAVVKLVLNEPGSQNVRSYYFGGQKSGFHITSVCLAEALGVLKRKRLRNNPSWEQYFRDCGWLLLQLRTRPRRIHIDEIDLSSPDTFAKAEEIARQYKLDWSDALQLFSVKHLKFSRLVQESKTILITADPALASAAKAEGLRVWNCEEEAAPPAQ